MANFYYDINRNFNDEKGTNLGSIDDAAKNPDISINRQHIKKQIIERMKNILFMQANRFEDLKTHELKKRLLDSEEITLYPRDDKKIFI